MKSQAPSSSLQSWLGAAPGIRLVGTRSTASPFFRGERHAVERVPTPVTKAIREVVPGPMLWGWLLLASLSLNAQTSSPLDQIPPLRPPHGEIPPSFWEQHGPAVVLGALLLLALLCAAVWWLTRPRPPVITPPAEQARQELEPLARQPEDGLVLSRVSQVLRHYLAAAFNLPPGELTTTDFCHALISHADVGPAVSVPVTNFLRQCDERKFAPRATGAPLGAAARALQLLEQAEARRQALAAATAAAATPSK